MAVDKVGAVRALLEETEAAHGAYEATVLTGIYDEHWPDWYAQYLVDHGLPALLDTELNPADVSARLTAIDAAYRQAAPAGTPWAAYAAARLTQPG